MSGSERPAPQGQVALPLHVEMPRVPSFDPRPPHKNAETWLREDTRGWGPAR